MTKAEPTATATSATRTTVAALAHDALAAAVAAGLGVERALTVIRRLFPSECAEQPSWDEVQLAHPSAARAAGQRTLGEHYQSLLAERASAARKRRGSFYTPAPLARAVCERALAPSRRANALDPACGAGAILLEALGFLPADGIYGADVDPVAVWLARVSLALASERHSDPDLARWITRVRVRDALDPNAFDPDCPARFDAIVANPPWVAFAGRAAEPLDPAVRRGYERAFASFHGYPTLHGMFVERAAQLLAPGGVLSILLPLPLADLNGYRATRAALARYARVHEPLEELGFDQFEGVVQPTMILVATAHDRRDDHAPLSLPSPAAVQPRDSGAPWALRAPVGAAPRTTLPRSLLDRLAQLPRFAPDTFGEGGFQSAGEIARTHIGPLGGEPRFRVPLREGADVEAFACRPPAIGLDPDPAALAAARCSLRPEAFYARVTVLLRQTARYPIACRHEPVSAFRNSLLAGFSDDPDALCALLNSALLRATHLSSQRDGRQQVFPQLKVGHLRALPAPPEGASLDALRALSREVAAQQRARIESALAYGAAPRNAFSIERGAIPGSANYARSLRDPAQRERYDRALAEARALYSAARALLERVDRAVFELYSVSDEEAERARAVLDV